MIQKMILEVETDKPIERLGNGHIILYDNTKKRYYATTREQFLQIQDEKIENLRKEFEILKKENEEFARTMKETFAKNTKIQKETNSKLIEMVKSVVVEEK